MTEQQACTLCGAGGHTAANCIWNGSEKGLALVQRIDKNLAERAQFESWVRREWPGAPLHHVRDALPMNAPRYGEYCNENIQRAWVGWQARAAQAGQVPQAWIDVQAERRRQVDVEGWTPEHDDRHDDGKIAEQAASFLMNGQSPRKSAWSWKHKHPDSPTRASRRRQLVIGVALGLAEIERLDRAAAPAQGGD